MLNMFKKFFVMILLFDLYIIWYFYIYSKIGYYYLM